jgi:UDP-N-acetylglucosamine--N-acetylmuramyl-(pentapeptide) pyrophosphoryl-undecaprenol N-acetylglucosamine transferase
VPLRVVIAAGGTGGHIVPGLAIARELVARYDAEVTFAGTERGFESRLVPAAGFRLALLASGPLKSVSPLTRLKSMIAVPRGIWQSLRLLRKTKADVVVGVGGYASGPVMAAARLLRIPKLVFEPNAMPGIANRIAGKWAQAAAINFPEAAKYFKHPEVTGIPVRPEFFDLPPKPAGAPLKLLVFGGSQGARVLNHRVPDIAQKLIDELPGLTILHQAGQIHETSAEHLYRQRDLLGHGVEVRAFLDDMPRRFAEADLVLCRSGASTVAELAAAGKPSVLVPFPAATDDHQLKNAEAFAKSGAAVVIEERYLTSELLLQALLSCLRDPEKLRAMGEAAQSQAHRGAAARIAEMVAGLAKRKHDPPA